MFNFTKNFIFINLIFINILNSSSSWACDRVCDDVMDVETPGAGVPALNIESNSLSVSPIYPTKPKRLLEEDTPRSNTPYKKTKISEGVVFAGLSSGSNSEFLIQGSLSFQDDSKDLDYSPAKGVKSFNSDLTPTSKGRYKNKNKKDKVWRKSKRNVYFEDVIFPEIKDNIESNIGKIRTLCEKINLPNTEALLSYIANRAAVSYSEKLEGSNTNLGTYRHSFCQQYIHALQNLDYLKHLKTEVSYFEGQEKAAKGCVRLDVYWPACQKNNNKGRVYDFKFYDEGENQSLTMNHPEWKKHVPGGDNNQLIFIIPILS